MFKIQKMQAMPWNPLKSNKQAIDKKGIRKLGMKDMFQHYIFLYTVQWGGGEKAF